MNTNTLLLMFAFKNIFFYFWMIAWIENLNDFQKAKVQPQGVALHLLDSWPISAWRCF